MPPSVRAGVRRLRIRAQRNADYGGDVRIGVAVPRTNDSCRSRARLRRTAPTNRAPTERRWGLARPCEIAYPDRTLATEAPWPASSSPPPCRTSTASSTSATSSGSHAAGRRLRPLPARRAATRCCSSAPPTSTARRPSSPPPRPASRSPTTAHEQHEVQTDAGRRLPACPSTSSAAPPRPQNHRLTQHFAGRLDDAGLIEERVDQQVYSVADGRFLPDRYVEGTCPNCGYDARARRPVRELHQAARPDRPDQPALGHLRLDRPRDPRHQAPLPAPVRAAGPAPRLDRHQDRLAAPDHLDRPQVARRGEGLQRPRHHPRPRLGRARVGRGGEPWPGHRGQGLLRLVRRADRIHRLRRRNGPTRTAAPTPTGSAGGAPTRARPTSATSQFMGKDNVAFHTVSFPATILGSGEPWKLVDHLKAFNWLNWYGGKFSTSQKRGVFMDQALELLPADYWRWWLTGQRARELGRELHLGAASRPAVNKDLADVLGNFVNRITKFAAAKFGGDRARGRRPRAARRRRSIADLDAAHAAPTRPHGRDRGPQGRAGAARRSGCSATSTCRPPRPGPRSRPTPSAPRRSPASAST